MKNTNSRARTLALALVAVVAGTVACATARRGAYPAAAREEPSSSSPHFVHAGVNPVVATAEDPLSTFAVDVDTGSWMYAKRALADGGMPEAGGVRVEEFVNAMHYAYDGPVDNGDALAVHVAAAPSPFAHGKEIVRVALQARRVDKAARKPATLTFLVDVSGSMNEPDKLPWVKRGLHMAVEALRPDDRVAIVTYAGATRLVLPATSASEKRTIDAAIETLESGGGTFMSSGMKLAYAEATKELSSGRSSRVFVLSDGDANIGNTSSESILADIKQYVADGVTMSTMGFGTGNYNDALMEQLADAGNGNYTYIGDERGLQRFFVDDMTSTLQVVAHDAKIQVEWNPSVVSTYRLLGYEDRAIADADFTNDKKDAGEVGAGHAVTALYEITRVADAPLADLGTVHVRYAVRQGAPAVQLDRAIAPRDVVDEVDALDSDAQAAIGMALGAEILRGSEHVAGLTLVDAAILLDRSARGPNAEERKEAAALFRSGASRAHATVARAR